MKNFDTRVYSVGDFLEWNSNGLLELSPDFQRRGVWTKQAKSYLMDTILSGKPMPKILMTQRLDSSRNTRVIIDGQQRLRAILEFCNDEYTISKTHSTEFGGKPFSALPVQIRNDIFKYEVGVDVLFDLSYEETLDIFARLNTYSVRLNKQELLNAVYLGPFKQGAFKLGYAYVQYWLNGSILTKAKVSRMGEAELASDILVVAVDGIQSNKQIEKYYKLYEDDTSDLSGPIDNARQALNIISEIYPGEEIKATNFRRIHVYYSLYCAVFHCLHGIKGFSARRASSLKGKIGKLRVALDNLSAAYDAEDAKLAKFIDASRRATTDVANRRYRAEVICDVMASA